MKLNIGTNIRLLRRQADMTQEQLAERLGVTYQSVSRWENEENYPDLELIPRIASIFEVTADTLLATTESVEERFRLHTQALEEASRENNTDKAVDILKDIALSARDYSEQSFMHITIPLEQYGLIKDSRVIEQLVKTVEAFLRYTTRQKSSYLIQSLSAWVEDEDFDGFLEKYASQEELTYHALRLYRYSRRNGHWKELVKVEQRNLYAKIMDICLDRHTWHTPCGMSSQYSFEYIRYTTLFCLDLLHRFNEIIPAPEYPVSGDGEVDIFVDARLYLGIRLAAIRAYENDREGMYTALEDTVSLMEKLVDMGEILTQEQMTERYNQRKAKTHECLLQEVPNITCHSRTMEGYIGGVVQQWGKKWAPDQPVCLSQFTSIHLPYYTSNPHPFLIHHDLTKILQSGFTTWFHPFREEERYRALSERAGACIRTRPIES